MSPILGIWASAQQAAFVVGDYESIATVTVGSGGSSSVTFSSIPSTYQHLQIRLISRDTGTGTGQAPLWLRFNSDSGSNYSWHRIYGNGTTSSSDSGTSDSWILAGIGSENADPANTFSTTIVDVLDYANVNKNKTIRGLSGEDINGTGGYVGLHSGSWQNTNAVTSVTVFPNATQSFVQYSSFALYGLKG